MKTKGSAWLRNAGTLAAIILVLVMGTSPALAKEQKHGKELTVQKKDGEIIRGELIAVRKNSLLLDSLNSADNSIDIGDISAVTINNKSQFLAGAGIGFLSGAALGIAVGVASGSDETGWFRWTAGQKAQLAGALLGAVGVILGGIIGAGAGIDETIKIKETGDPYQIPRLIGKLRPLARFPDEK